MVRKFFIIFASIIAVSSASHVDILKSIDISEKVFPNYSEEVCDCALFDHFLGDVWMDWLPNALIQIENRTNDEVGVKETVPEGIYIDESEVNE